MAVLLTYDIATKHPEMHAALKAKGYLNQWRQNGLTIHLPSCSLWKSDGSPSVAMNDIRVVANVLQVKLERCITVEFGATHGIPGEPQ